MIELVWCRVAMASLILLQPAWFAWLNPPAVVPVIVVLAVSTLPLLIMLPGTWQLRPRALVVAGCLLLLYFSFAVMEAWANPAARVPALLQIGLIAVYFTALPALRRQPADSD